METTSFTAADKIFLFAHALFQPFQLHELKARAYTFHTFPRCCCRGHWWPRWQHRSDFEWKHLAALEAIGLDLLEHEGHTRVRRAIHWQKSQLEALVSILCNTYFLPNFPLQWLHGRVCKSERLGSTFAELKISPRPIELMHVMSMIFHLSVIPDIFL